MGLVRSTVCYYCLGGCSALVVCARRSRLAWGVGAGAGSCLSPGALPCPRVPRVPPLHQLHENAMICEKR